MVTPVRRNIEESCIDRPATPLIEPVKWCCRQVRNLFSPQASDKRNCCASIAARISLFVVAILALIPSAFLSIFGLLYQATCQPTQVNGLDEIRGGGKGKSSPAGGSSQGNAATRSGQTLFDQDTEFANTDEFNTKAMLFFKDAAIKNKRSLSLDLSKLGDKPDDLDVIENLVKGQWGFCIGENSLADCSSKRFLIDNMEYLKNCGVRVIFLSGIDHKRQEALDKYLSGEWDANNPQVAGIVQYCATVTLNEGGNLDYSDWSIVEAAKKQGIRVVALDYDRNAHRGSRMLKFNYLAAKIMDREMVNFGSEDRFCTLTDYSALCRLKQDPHSTPGLSEIFECPAVTIRANEVDPTVSTASYSTLARDGFNGTIHANLFRAI